jgi:hypothetical protein
MIDDYRQLGMFLLTGSTNLLHWPRLPDSLAGRVEYITLRPLFISEIKGQRHIHPIRKTQDPCLNILYITNYKNKRYLYGL